MNIVFKSLFVLVFATGIYAGHHEGGDQDAHPQDVAPT